MHRHLLLPLACVLFAIPLTAFAEPGTPPVTAGGVDTVATTIAGRVTDTTLTAMSPLLVVSAQGAWAYFQADGDSRASLPWFASPWIWGTLLGLGGLFTLNTVVGNAVPLLKTPMNVVEEHENKITGLLIGLPVVLTRLFPDLQMPPPLQQAGAGGAGGLEGSLLPLAMSIPWSAALLAVPIVVACYLMVWLTFHSLHVIALVSPFGIIDTGLKLSRLGLLGGIALLSVVSPLLGVILCAAIIVASYFVAGWSFRLLVFGTLLSWDLLLFRHRRPRPDAVVARGFLCRPVGGAPARSYGILSRDSGGGYQFTFRPWLCLPPRSVPLQAEALLIQRGILSPVAARLNSGHAAPQGLVRLRPRFRGHEESIAAHLDARRVEDHAVTRGLRQATAWLRDMFPVPALRTASHPGIHSSQ